MPKGLVSAGVVGMLTLMTAGAQAQTVACPVFGPKAVVGAAVGTAVGAGLGNLLSRGRARGAGTLFGGLAGGVLGGAVGASLDQQDCAQAQLALQQMANQPTGQQIPWSNSNSGDHGALTPTSNAIVAANGQLCRNYHTDAVAKDGSVTSHDGLTCRDASTGDWKAVS